MLCFSVLLWAESTYKSSSVSSNYTKREYERRRIPSASSALLVGCVLGIIQTLFLTFSAKPILSYMGVNSVSALAWVIWMFGYYSPFLLYLLVFAATWWLFTFLLSCWWVDMMLVRESGIKFVIWRNCLNISASTMKVNKAILCKLFLTTSSNSGNWFTQQSLLFELQIPHKDIFFLRKLCCVCRILQC